ncbi:transporter substrate-binding domain-containing protein [Alcaligenaceae bacterium]|nr:transporter substrate-binding domain-containing protein [Alcaligenaceae bacterium]
MKFSSTLKKSGIALVLLATSAASQADGLDKIRAAGAIKVAIAIGVPIFSYPDANMRPEGSDIDTARLLAQDLGVQLELVQITNAARIPTVHTGKADIAIASLSITPKRAQVVDFSVPYASLQTLVAAPEHVSINSYAGLQGLAIGVTRATVNDTDISKNAGNAHIRRYEDDASLVSAAISGQVIAVSTQWPNVVEINKRQTADPYVIKFVQGEFMLGIAMQKNNPKLKAWIDQWVTNKLKNGDLNRIYKKHHGVDLSAAVLNP